MDTNFIHGVEHRFFCPVQHRDDVRHILKKHKLGWTQVGGTGYWFGGSRWVRDQVVIFIMLPCIGQPCPKAAIQEAVELLKSLGEQEVLVQVSPTSTTIY